MWAQALGSLERRFAGERDLAECRNDESRISSARTLELRGAILVDPELAEQSAHAIQVEGFEGARGRAVGRRLDRGDQVDTSRGGGPTAKRLHGVEYVARSELEIVERHQERPGAIGHEGPCLLRAPKPGHQPKTELGIGARKAHEACVAPVEQRSRHDLFEHLTLARARTTGDIANPFPPLGKLHNLPLPGRLRKGRPPLEARVAPHLSKSTEKLASAGVAVRGMLREQPLDCVRSAWCHPRSDPAQSSIFGWLVGRDRKREGPQSVEIRRDARWVSKKELWRRVAPGNRHRERSGRVSDRRTQIQQRDYARRLIDAHVSGFQISVDEPGVVDKQERPGRVDHDLRQPLCALAIVLRP